jgi:catechol 2,3-dioxygenase-like lactoylglutathione lyase family enzyme
MTTSILTAAITHVHLGLAVRDLSASRRFYALLLGAEPCKERPGYAKFVLQRPGLNLSLSEVRTSRPAPSGAHYGLEVGSEAEVRRRADELRAGGLEPRLEEATTCCYAVQTKAWLTDPDGNEWELFTVLEDSAVRIAPPSSCCS